MLRIRHSQFDELSRSGFRGVLDLWTQELRGEYPDETAQLSDDELRQLLGEGADHAAGYGLTELFHVREYLELVLRFGTTPDGAPTSDWQLQILENSELNETQKIDRLAVLVDELDGEEEEDDDDDSGDAEASAPDEPEDDEPDLPVDPKFDVPPDPEEMEIDVEPEEDDVW